MLCFFGLVYRGTLHFVPTLRVGKIDVDRLIRGHGGRSISNEK